MKIIFLDADGTLFHSDGYIPDSAKQACLQAQKNGHKICLCTGRQKAEVYGDMTSLDYDAMICGAGAYVEAKGEVIQKKYFSQKQIHFLHDYFIKKHIPAVYESFYDVVAFHDTKEIILNMIKEQCQNLSKEEYKNNGLVSFYHTIQEVDSIDSYSINKISFLESKNNLKDIIEDLKEQFEVIPATFAPLGKESGEIASYDISKGDGIKTILHHFNVSKDDAISVGDGFNDLSMFEETAISVAMSNAPIEVQKKASFVTTSIDDYGIYNAFNLLKLL